VIVAPTLLLVEVAGAIARRTGDAARTERIIRLTRSLSGLRWVSLTAGLGDRAAKLATELRLRGADAIYVALADRLDIPLVTWNGEQLSRANPRIRVSTPTTT
jgi:predicted nucleic acid-binding protein